MRIGITGGTSGLGKRLAEKLIAMGYTVRVLARESSDISDLKIWGAEIFYGDITDYEALISFVKDLDICYHLAAQVASSTKSLLFSVNVEGTRNVCESVAKNNPKCRFVYCSSIVVKGVKLWNKVFLSNYTISKYKAEQVVDEYIRKKKLQATIIYPGYIYGPYDRNFMPTILKMLKSGLKFVIKGGEKNAPVIYIDDLCELFILAGTKEIAIGKKYVSLRESDIGIHRFLEMVADKMNYSFPSKVYPKTPLVILALFLKIFNIKAQRKINMRIIGALSNKAEYFNNDAVRDLGWDHKVSIKDGIDKALEWQKLNT